MQILGVVDGIRFYNAHSGYVILKISVDFQKDILILTGKVDSRPVIGQEINAEGHFFNHPNFGLQFICENKIVLTLPKTSLGLKKMMSSGFVKGIGKKWAEKLIDHFGVDFLNIIRHNPERCGEIQGLSGQRLQNVLKTINEHFANLEIYAYLSSLGLGSARIDKLTRRYGAAIVDKINKNPYEIYKENRGFGFVLADKIAKKNGLEYNSPDRIMACCIHLLEEAMQFGHCYLKYDILLKKNCELLDYKVDNKSLDFVLSNEIFYILNDHISLYDIFSCEKNVAVLIDRLNSFNITNLEKNNLSLIFKKLISENQSFLTQEQEKAIFNALQHPCFILTGGPGVGKTTVIRALLRIFESSSMSVSLLAPTGRAAKKLKETTLRYAQTIHKLLKKDDSNGKFIYNENNLLTYDVYIVDEVSMVDIVLMSDFIRVLPLGCRLIMVGDIDQLPSVGPGNVLADLIASNKIAVSYLTQIFRQARYSKIIQSAHNVRNGFMPSHSSDGDFIWHKIENDECINQLKNIYSSLQGFDLIKDVQVLTSMHKGSLGTKNLNLLIKSWLNPSNSLFSVGDKVIQLKNNYEKNVFNGDIGFISNLGDDFMLIDFDGVSIRYENSDFDEIQLSYASTVHKSQGSEYPVVIFIISAEHFMLLQRNLLYTAITRARKQLFLLGSAKSVAISIKNNKSASRNTNLLEFLCNTLSYK